MTTTETTGTVIEFQGFELREVIDTRTGRSAGIDVYKGDKRVYVGYSSFKMARNYIAAGAFDRA